MSAYTRGDSTGNGQVDAAARVGLNPDEAEDYGSTNWWLAAGWTHFVHLLLLGEHFSHSAALLRCETQLFRLGPSG
jgi:hypothetical protein